MESVVKRLALLIFLFASFGLMAQMRMISHVTRATGDNTGFATDIILENQAVDATEYRLVPYDNAGNALEVVSGELAGRASLSRDAAELLPADTSHFAIEGEDVRITAAYRARSGGGSPAHVGESDEQASSYRLFTGNWESVFDGFAVVNRGGENADVWVAQVGFDGEVQQTVLAVADLAPLAKGLFIIGDPNGSPFSANAESYYEVYSTQGLAITALRGNIPGSTFLWTNDAEPQNQSVTTRDAQGVFYIKGGSFYDVIWSLGYNMAVDRLWQAESFRRQSRGRLAEIGGPGAVAIDTFSHTIAYTEEELEEAYQNLSPDARSMVKAYVDGINRRVAEVNAVPAILPFEFGITGVVPVAKWSVTDVLSWMSFLLRQFDPNGFGQGQLDNAALYQHLQNDFPETAAVMFEDLRWINDPGAQTMIHDFLVKEDKPPAIREPLPPIRNDINFSELARTWGQRARERDEYLKSINAKVQMGSYAWVVSGEKTDTGNPIIYSGPQMGFGVPAIVMEVSIDGGGLKISGMTVPGIPGIIIGRTPHHAWSMQVGHAHTADLYIEPPSALTTAEHRTETIKVLGAADVVIDVYRTQHGPVMTQDPAIISWKYAHWGNEFDTIQGFLDLARAESIEEFGEGVRKAGVSQHFCYADRDGNIAYWMSGRDPIRPEGEYRMPQGSVAPPLEYDIDNVRDLAHDSNTPLGYYGGWNNKASKDYNNAPIASAANYGPYHRAHVVDDYLAASDNLSFEEIRDFAIDIAATDGVGSGGNPWQFIQDEFKAAVEADSNQARNEAVALLDAWDGHFVDGGEVRWISGTDRADGWILLDVWLTNVLINTFSDELEFVPRSVMLNVLLHSFEQYASILNNYDWYTNLDPEMPQTKQEIIVQSLDEALEILGDRPWGTGLRGTIDYQHFFLGIQHRTPFANRSTYAHCVEMGANGPVRIESMFPLGQSGTIFNGSVLDPNYFSMVEFYDNFAPRSFPLFD